MESKAEESSYENDTASESLDYGAADDLSSDSGSAKLEWEERKRQRQDLLGVRVREHTKLPSKGFVADEYSREEYKRERYHLVSLDAYSRHKIIINNYLRFYGGDMADFKRDPSKDKTDLDVIREHHQFLWDDDDPADTWEKRLAKKYYDKLFKEYCIVDLSLYKKNKIAMRWRTEAEVVKGKGQFMCGEKRCEDKDLLRSWEVNFGYKEAGEKKNALIKLRLCPDCSYKLNYHHKKKEVTKQTKKRRASQEEVEDKVPKKMKVAEECTAESAGKAVDKEPESSCRDENVWSQERVIEKDKSKEEEFDEYFEDMFL